MSDHHAERLLCCAVSYRSANVPEEPVPLREASHAAFRRHLLRALVHEASESMRESIPLPTQPYLHPVDIDTDEPGIVTSRTQKTAIRRFKVPLPVVAYGVQDETPHECGSVDGDAHTGGATELRVPPPRTIEAAQKHAQKTGASALRAMQRAAQRDIRADEALRRREEERANKKNSKIAELKSIRLGRSLKIGQNDIEIRIRQTQKFLLLGHKVQVVQRFRGREVTLTDRGMKRLAEIADRLAPLSKVESPPRRNGRELAMVLAPDKVKIEKWKAENAELVKAAEEAPEIEEDLTEVEEDLNEVEEELNDVDGDESTSSES